MPNFKYPNNFDDDFINTFKKVLDHLNEMGYTYEESLQKAQNILDEAKTKSNNILGEAERVNAINENVQQQINTLIAESGTSDAEVLQARVDAEGKQYPVLKERLDRDENSLETRGTNIMYPPIPMIAAKPKKGEDQTAITQTLLDNVSNIYIPGEEFEIFGMLEIHYNKYVEMAHGAKLIKPENADNDLPVVWMNGSNSTLIGAGMRNSTIESKRRSPKGVVRLGYEDMDDTTARSIMYNNLSDFGISGRKSGGETEGEPSISLYMANPQVNNQPSYFHNITNIYHRYVNIGVMFEGWANSNIIRGMHFYSVGVNKNLGGGAMVFKETAGKGPLDNSISGVFHHFSANADTMVFDGESIMSSYNNIVAEQGGPQARMIYEKRVGSENNIISGIDNTAGGNSFGANFKENNTITLYNESYSRRTYANETITKDLKTQKLTSEDLNMTNYKAGTVQKTGLAEREKYEAFRIYVRANRSVYVEMDLTFHPTVALPLLWHTAKVGFSIKKDNSGNYSVATMLGHDTGGLILEPYEDSGELVFGFKVGNNGGNNSSTRANINYKVIGVDVDVKSDDISTIAHGNEIGRHVPITTLHGNTSNRPNSPSTGYQYFDTSLGKPIYWNGNNWVDATGSTV